MQGRFTGPRPSSSLPVAAHEVLHDSGMHSLLQTTPSVLYTTATRGEAPVRKVMPSLPPSAEQWPGRASLLQINTQVSDCPQLYHPPGSGSVASR